MSCRSGIPCRLRGAVSVALLAGMAGALLFGADAGAQEVRVQGTTSLRYVEARPFVRDSLLMDEVGGTGFLRQAADGGVVRCVVGDRFCRGMRPGTVVATVPATQDLEMSAWGFGEGIRVHAQARGRSALGGSGDFWPRADDRFDLLSAYGELNRERYRIRAGRQWATSGLGFYNFDGLAALGRPWTGLSVEARLGRSLVRGLNEPRTGGALAAIDDLAPEEPGIMLSAEARFQPSPRLSLAALYHRDIRRDRAGLYSELAGGQGVFRWGSGSLEGSLEADLATGQLNEGLLRVRPPPLGPIAAAVTARRYRPYFELWTIWGAFSPVGFDEARVDLSRVVSSREVLVRARASYRRYHDPGTATSVGRFRHEGWGVGADAGWFPAGSWRIDGGYRLEVSYGSTHSEGHASVRRGLGDRGHLALHGLAFQRMYEFRLEEGIVIGAGAEGSISLSERSRIAGGLTSYRHLDRGVQAGMDWTQLRGNVRVEWTVGAEPGRTGAQEVAR